jgi:hypothetical protein
MPAAEHTDAVPLQVAPPSVENVPPIKLDAIKKCQPPSHIPPGVVERLLKGEWIFTTDHELTKELIEIARCLSRKAKIALI